MFTYSTNLRGTITATLNSMGNAAMMDEEEEKPATEATQKDIELPPSWVSPLEITPKGSLPSIVHLLRHDSSSPSFRFPEAISEYSKDVFLQENPRGKIRAVQYEGWYCFESLRIC